MKTKIIMIDAFKPEYLEHAPYLKSLTKTKSWGELEMPPGHWGGMKIFFRGKSNILALFCKDRGDLSWIRYFTWLRVFGWFGRLKIDSMINLGRFLKGKELFRTGKIPFRKLWKYDICINKPVYSGLPVNYTYIKDLDSVGHKYGTKSKEMIQAVKKVDKKVSKMRFDIIFSDHGMADIKKTVKVPETSDCFIDSDMARYWGEKEDLAKIKKMLPLKYGKIINWPDKRFGDLIFIAKEGVLISPNFWQGKGKVKAMHGYDGKGKDMKAIYILNKKGEKKNLKVKELHKIFARMLKNGRK